VVNLGVNINIAFMLLKFCKSLRSLPETKDFANQKGADGVCCGLVFIKFILFVAFVLFPPLHVMILKRYD